MVESTNHKIAVKPGEQVELPQAYDYIEFIKDPKLMQLIGGEPLMFADKVKKTNMFNWTQTRTLVITKQAMYNIHGGKVKRCIQIKDISGLSKLTDPNAIKEFAVHVPTSYDYRFITDRRESIIELLKRLWFNIMKENLPIYHIPKPTKDLKDYTTTEKDMKKNTNRHPGSDFRALSEDLFDIDSGVQGVTEKLSSMSTTTTEETFEQQVNLRSAGHMADAGTSGSMAEAMDEIDVQTRQSMAKGAKLDYMRSDQKDAKLEDFIMKKMIGKGSFGKVFLVENVNDKRLYAMKCIRKDVILEHDQLENIRLEKDILNTINHPFLVNMEYVFQNEHRIYFLMKFIKGGELFRHFVQVKRFPEEHVRFFSAQVALALGHLHENKIIYRDLKPENILVGEDGYLMVADFGLAKFVQNNEMANSFCGTAEYLAPEMLIGNGHDYTVDWWALGILIYEMIVGIPPFFNRNKHKMYNLIKSGSINFPDPIKHKIMVSDAAKDLICLLLNKDKHQRLGAKNGADEILKHEFFKDIDMAKLIKKELEPPYKPAMSEDLAYFDQKLVGQEEMVESILPAARQQIVNTNKNQFDNFTS